MDLVICSTPLHIIQIASLIERKIVHEFEFVYFSKNDTKQVRFYFEKIKHKSTLSLLLINNKKFPFYLNFLRNNFKNKSYESVFFAGVDSPFVHMILSCISFKDIITIDDGAANINKEGHYYSDQRSLAHKMIYFLYGIKYNLKKVKNNIAVHYTIYPNHENITQKTKPNFLFNNRNENDILGNHIKGTANILLGTVYEDVSDKVESLTLEIRNFFTSNIFNGDVFYIPHPRDTSNDFEFLRVIDGLEIAEDKIINLLSFYKTINIYGFSSSAQINMMENSRITCLHLDSNYIKKNKYFFKEFEKINLSTFSLGKCESGQGS